MPVPATLRSVSEYWARDLFCRVEDLERPGVCVVSHDDASGYPGASVFRRGPACILSVPAALRDTVAAAVHGSGPAEVLHSAFLAGVFGASVERLIGPACLGYADATDFRPSGTRGARLLGPDDAPAFCRLAAACDPIEWEHSGLKFERPPTFACFAADEIAAATSYEVWGDRLAHIGVLTHPVYRGQGYGRAVVSALAVHALGLGLIAQYRTLVANTPSLAIGRALGFQEYAQTLFVRLRDAGA